MKVISLLDRVLRRLSGVFEFSPDPRCLLRVAVRRTRRSRILPDGTPLPAGSRIVLLHFWNEHIPRIATTGPDLAWSAEFLGRLRLSFSQLATSPDPRLHRPAALRGDLELPVWYPRGRVATTLARLGLMVEPHRHRLIRRLAGLYPSLLMRIHHPTAAGGAALWRTRRHRLWMTGATLADLYGSEHE